MGYQVQYKVSFEQNERLKLEAMSKDNQLSIRILKRTLILLSLDKWAAAGLNYKQIASTLDTTAATIARVAKDYATNGLDYTVSYHYNPASRKKAKVNEELEAYVIQLACGRAPGRLRRLDTGAS